MIAGGFQSYDIPFDADYVSVKVRIQLAILTEAEKALETQILDSLTQVNPKIGSSPYCA